MVEPVSSGVRMNGGLGGLISCFGRMSSFGASAKGSRIVLRPLLFVSAAEVIIVHPHIEVHVKLGKG